MAHPRKNHLRGKVIATVGHLRIYQKNTDEVSVINEVKKSRTVSTAISIYHRKKLLAKDFKNKAEAIEGAKQYISK